MEWIRDAFILRGSFAHGRKRSSGGWRGWTLDEHLLLASFAFQLILKVVLADRGLYQLTDADETALEALERLAATPDLGAALAPG